MCGSTLKRESRIRQGLYLTKPQKVKVPEFSQSVNNFFKNEIFENLKVEKFRLVQN